MLRIMRMTTPQVRRYLLKCIQHVQIRPGIKTRMASPAVACSTLTKQIPDLHRPRLLATPLISSIIIMSSISRFLRVSSLSSSIALHFR